ncbi:hypothetical protein [Frigidibacter sp. SD6-1]|uniref:hypothetical protein n=1 Tax=Frigidibacter sp. SD6-1 TaxID=3032581 RepID=UPI0024DFAAB9|nr:hypothetical protein [Frigidibacter sp. SD6-1]
MIRRFILILALGLVAAGAVFWGGTHRTVTIRLLPDVTYQTFRDWEATPVLLGGEEERRHRFDIFDRIAKEIPLTRLRVEVFSGAESRYRGMQRYLAGEIDIETWKALRYPTQNDDDDPNHINPAGFDFFDLDYRMDNTVLPMIERASARGESYRLTLTYVAFTKMIREGGYLHTDPAEYAEFILAAFEHLRDKYGVVPDYFDPLLEPDNVPAWTPETLGPAIRAAMDRLHGAGFHPGVILPSVSDAGETLRWLDGIGETDGALADLTEISFHRYKGADRASLEAIAARAAEMGVTSGMLEYWFGRATYQVLHQDLTVANVSSWQPRAVYSFYEIQPDGSLKIAEDIRYDRLYFEAIRPGDVRIGAEAPWLSPFSPVAFRKADGTMSVVLMARRAGSAVITRLPAGAYLEETATASPSGPPQIVQVGADGRLSITIDGPGVIAIHPAPAQG